MASKEKLTRIAIVSHDRCKPKKCRQECKKSCPVVRMGECLGRDEAASSALKSCTRGVVRFLGSRLVGLVVSPQVNCALRSPQQTRLLPSLSNCALGVASV